MADEPTGDLGATTGTQEHQEAETHVDTDDGYVFDFRNLDDQPIPEEGGEPSESVETKEPATPAGEEAAPEPKKEQAESKPEPVNQDLATMKQTVDNLNLQVANLNKALHQERQKKAEPKTDEALTDTQLKELFKLHADDPEELFKLTQYTAQRAARMSKEETLNAVEVAEQRKQAEAHVMSRWKPVLEGPEGPQVRQAVDGFKRIMGIENHPLAEHLAFGVFVHENLPQIQTFWFEKGKAEALTAAADKGRKDGLKEKNLAPAKGGKDAPATAGKESQYLANAKQLGLTPSATKAYIKTMMGKAKSNPSMMADAR